MRDGAKQLLQGEYLMPLPDLLLQIIEGGDVEKLPQGDVQPVAELLDSGDGDAVVPAADNVIESGLGHAADGRQTVDGDPALGAQLQYPGTYRCTAIHSASHPNAKELI